MSLHKDGISRFLPYTNWQKRNQNTVLLIISTPLAEKITKHTVNLFHHIRHLQTQTNRSKFERESEPPIALSETLLRSRVTGTRAKEDVEFQWGPKKAAAFKKLKNELARAKMTKQQGELGVRQSAKLWQSYGVVNVFKLTCMGSSLTL